ncbi:DUF4440 domain-containing protein [Lewinella sp. W8]|uniref:YybH family protein n=1 Tax=Lewinella sp. W8 TaxID=2528208 RepID=UPI0010681001|nr:nuclear transport factor 2 family protein [Lewinella sp. W8]MTB53523.1 hypothetical protein [Lewinella sp. W8]
MMRYLLLFLQLSAFATFTYAQETSITYELNGRASKEALEDGDYVNSLNPFVKFIGEWTLKDDEWTQNWGFGTETIKIPGHHTISREINTDHTLLSIIDGPEPNGHIFWTYSPKTGAVFHSSSFGSNRVGTGIGMISDMGDLLLKVTFEDEAEGTYRRYSYTWRNLDEYVLSSVQYDHDNQPTGLFYSGTFVRLKPARHHPDEIAIKREILEHGATIRAAFRAGDLEKIRSLHHPEVEKALGYSDVKSGREAVMQGLAGTLKSFSLEFVENDVESILIRGDLAIEQTKFAIRGTPKEGGESFLFRGRTQVTYVRYPDSPTGWATIREIIQPWTE